jgi:hypothetical protein
MFQTEYIIFVFLQILFSLTMLCFRSSTCTPSCSWSWERSSTCPLFTTATSFASWTRSPLFFRWIRYSQADNMDQITIMPPNPKCRLYWFLIEFSDWRYSQSCWYFLSLLWTSAPLTSHCWFTPPPSLCTQSTQVCIYSVCNRGGVDSEPTKLLYHSKQKPRRGGGLR